ncbi:MAG: ATP-binding cassette domain-containing protein [Bacteroidales bacterium]
MYLFTARDIVKRYTNHLALDRVTVNVPEGSVYGLLGPNGAGKTTLLRIINQISMPDEGELFFMGRKFQPDDVAHIGYLPEERGLYKKMKVGEQALYLAQLKGMGKAEAMKKLKHWFTKFEIQAWWNKKVEELSKGMQQKVQFVTTIIHEPRLLIFDEPFSGFDPINANMMKNEILELKKKGSTIIFSTHDMGSVEELCDYITLINKAKTILEGDVHNIRMEYKSNTFEIGFNGNAELVKNQLNGRCQLVELVEERDHTRIKIKADRSLSGNDMLNLILPVVSVTSFNEVIPTMNEIFIRVVEAQNQQKPNAL